MQLMKKNQGSSLLEVIVSYVVYRNDSSGSPDLAKQLLLVSTEL